MHRWCPPRARAWSWVLAGRSHLAPRWHARRSPAPRPGTHPEAPRRQPQRRVAIGDSSTIGIIRSLPCALAPARPAPLPATAPPRQTAHHPHEPGGLRSWWPAPRRCGSRRRPSAPRSARGYWIRSDDLTQAVLHPLCLARRRERPYHLTFVAPGAGGPARPQRQPDLRLMTDSFLSYSAPNPNPDSRPVRLIWSVQDLRLSPRCCHRPCCPRADLLRITWLTDRMQASVRPTNDSTSGSSCLYARGCQAPRSAGGRPQTTPRRSTSSACPAGEGCTRPTTSWR